MASSQVSKEPVKNPYISRGAIQDPCHFFGRVQETREILDLTSGGQSVSIVGPRKIGKTSLLLHVRRSAPPVEAGKKTRHLYIFLDLQGKPQASQPEICQWMWNETLKTAGPVKRLPTAVESAEEFEKAVRELCAADFKLTLLVDEFELMAQNPQIDFNFLSRLCSLSTAQLVNYVMTSRRPLSDLEYKDPFAYHSSFFTIFDQRHLGFLMPAEARELVCKPVQDMGFPDLTEEEVEFLFDLAGYHPACLQIACYCLFEHKLTGQILDKQAKDEVRRKFKDRVGDYFHQIWKDLRRDEQEAMRLVAAGQTGRISDKLWDALAHQCLVYEKSPFSSVFKEFVLQQGAVPDVGEKPGPPLSPPGSIAWPRSKKLAIVLEILIFLLVLMTLVGLTLAAVFKVPALVYISFGLLITIFILSLLRSLAV